VLFGITVIAFTALALAPGDPVTARLDPAVLAQLSKADLDARRHELGLDQPIPVRYAIWLGGILHGDLGYSVVTRRSVADEVSARVLPTVVLMGTALVIGCTVGISLGVLAAVKRYSVPDYVFSTVGLLAIVIPGFVLGLISIYVFAVGLRWLPAGGIETLGAAGGTWQDQAAHLVLPACILGLALAAQILRYTRASMLDVLSSEFITTARAKGLSSIRVIGRHALGNALIPIITVIGLALPDTVAGAVITEQVFSWPGMGRLAVTAANNRDAAVMMAVVLIVATVVLLVNIVTDLAYGLADPRIRLGARA
jgi:ABC-type dipeptide/oligopeptide/nickel transport system permease component